MAPKKDNYAEPSTTTIGERRIVLKSQVLFLLGFAACAWTAVQLLPMRTAPNVPREDTIESRVDRILSHTPLIDGHNDLAYFLRWAHNNHIYFHNFTEPFEQGSLGGEVDLARLRAGRVGGTFWSVFADCPKHGYTQEYFAESVATTEAAIDVIHRLFAAYPAAFGPLEQSSEAVAIFQSGRIISPIGLEGLHLIGDSFTKLRDYHARGIRYATLTHNCWNAYADSALAELPDGGLAPARPHWGGISPAGRRIVDEMNRLGILVDLSHTSADTMRDALGREGSEWQGSLSPPIFSHSSAFAICPHPRNVPDDVLRLVAARNGLVMVTFTPEFISCRFEVDGEAVDEERPGKLPVRYDANLTIAQVVRHMRYIGEFIGYDHVGIGSDFDGVASVIPELKDVSKFPDLVAEMLSQGIRDADVAKIVGGNLLRVWRDVDAVAERLRVAGEAPAEDDLPSLPDPWKA